MKKILKKISILALALVLTMGTTVCSFADESSVTYEGDADQFVFLPGSGYSPTDLFTNFKGVMPGDTLTQDIEIKNTTNDEYEVEIFIKALGASDLVDADGNVVVSQEQSADFLKEMNLTVTPLQGGEYFDAPADQTGDLTEWVSLGKFYYNADVTLRVNLEVPITMGNDFQQRIGALQWTFKAVEIPIPEEPSNISPGDDDGDGDKDKDKDKDGKPDSAKTGDDMNLFMIIGICIAALVVILVLVFGRRRREE